MGSKAVHPKFQDKLLLNGNHFKIAMKTQLLHNINNPVRDSIAEKNLTGDRAKPHMRDKGD